jgi:hypothetical protein
MLQMIKSKNIDRLIQKKTSRYDEDWLIEPLYKLKKDCVDLEKSINKKLKRETHKKQRNNIRGQRKSADDLPS